MWLYILLFVLGIGVGIAIDYFLLHPSTASKKELADWTSRLESALKADGAAARNEVGNVAAEIRKKV